MLLCKRFHKYNYVYFNCDDLNNQSASTCEVWRIIGVFDVDDGTGSYEQRIKLVRGSALPDTKQWDNRESYSEGGCSSCGKNEWEGSLMQIYLNDEGEYYTRSGSAANYGLKTNAKTLISDAKYYLGGATYNEGYGTADAVYLWERGSEVYSYDSYCNYSTWDSNWNNRCTTENYCENNPTDEICSINRSISWVGEVALMYPSDEYLVYANGVDAACYGNPVYCNYNVNSGRYGMPTTGWIYNSNNSEGQNSPTINWFLSPYLNFSSGVFNVESNGQVNIDSSSGVSSSYAVRPVVYLKSSINIISGEGTEQNPYVLQ